MEGFKKTSLDEILRHGTTMVGSSGSSQTARPTGGSNRTYTQTYNIATVAAKDAPLDVRHNRPILPAKRGESPLEVRHRRPMSPAKREESPLEVRHTRPILPAKRDESPLEVRHRRPMSPAKR